jgi:hypothetical protein
MLESTQGRNLTTAILKDVARPSAIVIISSHTHYPTRVNVHTPARIPPADALSPNVTLGNRIWPDTSAPTANTSLRMKQSDVKFLIPSIRMRFASLLSRPSMEFKVTTLVFKFACLKFANMQILFGSVRRYSAECRKRHPDDATERTEFTAITY